MRRDGYFGYGWTGKVELATSRALLRELKRVLQRPPIRQYQKLAPDELSRLVELIAAAAMITLGRYRGIRIVQPAGS
ncbi:MAG TPA: hypothetical protein ENN53_03370 [Candidatus Acetothermia bacterium]|nr:hypothetical protein [Candidatus Acetothermia bacterium]